LGDVGVCQGKVINELLSGNSHVKGRLLGELNF
jgi:hypothetical protein